MTKTFAEALDLANVTIPPELEASAMVPVLTGPQRQGDVGIFPRPAVGAAERAAFVEVPTAGIAVVRGEAATGANSHILHGDGPVFWSESPTRDGGVTLGILDVPEGSTAYLIHTDEHGANAMGPGTYRVTGKREQADEIRRVAD